MSMGTLRISPKRMNTTPMDAKTFRQRTANGSNSLSPPLEIDIEAGKTTEATTTYYPRSGGPSATGRQALDALAGDSGRSPGRPLFMCLLILLALLFVLSFVGQWKINVGSDGARGVSVMWRAYPSENVLSAGQFNNPPSLPPGALPFAVITDLDRNSRIPGDSKPMWGAFLKRGWILLPASPKELPTITWLDQGKGVQIKQNLNDGARGMELSELIVWRGKLLAPDDRTGIVYEIENPWSGSDGKGEPPQCIARFILSDGPGHAEKGFKSEWMADKDGTLYIGSHGREFTDPKEGTKIVSNNPEWVKTVTPALALSHVDWTEQFNYVRKIAGLAFPGYLEHEAATWSPFRREWIFAPRRWSNESYHEELNELRGWNKIIRVSEDFSASTVVEIKFTLEPQKGFSTIKLIPGTKDEWAVALRTLEREKLGIYKTTMTIFNVLTGAVWLPDINVEEAKYEGLAFL
eukprot:gb/GEZN01007677.1/.p1 GENE.gb/GEZN01007677.1/~~gb/GEZN01007677.1/.p1  ORF type:complete len:464 (-),score=33.00 gb/GEZN01007677.1/:54-1445(-)